ncbi:MAG TPA: DUF4350 domain-containing protein [Terracidiphilus sp.]|nr:DUF4350 domain-containing protein [Terracidiphilus sp.]
MRPLSALSAWHFWPILTLISAVITVWILLRLNKGKAGFGLPSWFLSSLDQKDRLLLLWCVGIAVVLSVAIGFLLPGANSNSNPLPSTYLSGQHGARAAYETLLRSGYQIDRWERPLSELAATAGPDMVVIFAEPLTREPANLKAVRQILERGGRVLATGYWGAFILPGEASDTPQTFNFAACKLEPEGLDPLAGSGEVWMVSEATWKAGNPAHRVDYNCAGEPAVVEYDWGKGHAVWWDSSTPLENGSLARAHDLDLLLNSVGPREGHHFYWDESLHGEIRSTWSYASGPAWNMLWIGLAVLGLLVVLSFSRRTGPVRELPAAMRTTPIEFLEALGSLYRSAGAASTAVAIALERFRRHVLRFAAADGLRGKQMNAAELTAVLRRRYPQTEEGLEEDLKACEEAAWGETVTPREALKLIQKLHGHEERLRAAAKPGAAMAISKNIHSNKQERAS